MNAETKKIRASLEKLYKIYMNCNKTWESIIILGLLDKSKKENFTKEQSEKLQVILKRMKLWK